MLLMFNQKNFVWIVRGLNMAARRAVVRDFAVQERVSVLCLLERKLVELTLAAASELCWPGL